MSQSPDAPDPRRVRLSAAETTDLAGQLATLAQAGLPLAPGLRAAAEELRGSRLARVLTRLAQGLESGQPLDAAIAAQGRSFPPHLRHLILGTAQSDRLARVLGQVVSAERKSRELRQRLWTNLAYPLFLLGLVLFLLGFVVQWLIPQIAGGMAVLSGGNTPSPVAVLGQDLSVTGQFLFWLLAIFLSLALLLWIASRLGATHIWAQVVQAVPLLGPVVRWSRMVRFTRLMEVLLEERTPLPEALRLIAATVPDSDLASGCLEAATRVEAGIPLAQSLAELPQFPLTLLPFVEWGQSQPSLTEAFRAAAESFEDRLDAQVSLVEGILPSTIFLLVASLSLVLFGSLLRMVSPLLALAASYSGGSALGLMFVISDPLELLAGMGPLLFGLALLATLRILSDPLRPATRDATQQALYVIGWVLVTVGALGTLTMLFGFVVAIVAVVMAIRLVFRRRRTQRRAFVALLAASAERLMPLVPAIEAFARECRGALGHRALRLADRLRAGQPLPAALLECRGLLARGTLPLILAGYESGALAEALRESLQATGLHEPMVRTLRSRLFYLLGVVLLMQPILGFLLLKIAPAMQKIFSDFGTRVPPTTQWVISLGYVFERVLPWAILCLLLSGILLLVSVGVRGWDVPGLRRLTRRLDRAALLEALRFVADRRRPLPDALRSLAETVPSWTLRRRLGKVAGEVEAGAPLPDSLGRHGLLSEAECATLAAAARVGNLPWTLRELADSNRRWWLYRSQMLLNAFFPLVILALGSVVVFYVVGYFLPFVALIEGLIQ